MTAATELQDDPLARLHADLDALLARRAPPRGRRRVERSVLLDRCPGCRLCVEAKAERERRR